MLHTQCYNTFPVSCTDNTYLLLMYILNICVYSIHLSVHVTVHVWTYPGAYTATWLALTIHFLFVGSPVLGDSSSCMKWTGTRSTQGSVKDHTPSNLNCTCLAEHNERTVSGCSFRSHRKQTHLFSRSTMDFSRALVPQNPKVG